MDQLKSEEVEDEAFATEREGDKKLCDLQIWVKVKRTEPSSEAQRVEKRNFSVGNRKKEGDRGKIGTRAG